MAPRPSSYSTRHAPTRSFGARVADRARTRPEVLRREVACMRVASLHEADPNGTPRFNAVVISRGWGGGRSRPTSLHRCPFSRRDRPQGYAPAPAALARHVLGRAHRGFPRYGDAASRVSWRQRATTA